MATNRHRPTYSLEEVKSLSASDKLRVNGRSLRWIRNHLGRFDGICIVRRVIDSIEQDDFDKSVSLRVEQGAWADVYKFVFTGDEELDGEDGWYVKLYIGDDDEMLHLNVLSANWEGYIH